MASTSSGVGPPLPFQGKAEGGLGRFGRGLLRRISRGRRRRRDVLGRIGRALVRPRDRFRGQRHVGLGRVGRALRRRSCGVTAIAFAGLQRAAFHMKFIFGPI